MKRALTFHNGSIYKILQVLYERYYSGSHYYYNYCCILIGNSYKPLFKPKPGHGNGVHEDLHPNEMSNTDTFKLKKGNVK